MCRHLSTSRSPPVRLRSTREKKANLFEEIGIVVDDTSTVVVDTNRRPLTQVKTLSVKHIHATRAGVIPYTTDPYGEVYVCLGVDPHFTLTNFGGGIGRRDVSAVDAAWREFKEETLNVFDGMEAIPLSDCKTIIGNHDFNIFVPLKYTDDLFCKTQDLFKERLHHEAKPEVVGLYWMSLHDFIAIIQKKPGPVLYDVVQRSLYPNIPYLAQLGQLQGPEKLHN